MARETRWGDAELGEMEIRMSDKHLNVVGGRIYAVETEEEEKEKGNEKQDKFVVDEKKMTTCGRKMKRKIPTISVDENEARRQIVLTTGSVRRW